MTRRTVRGKIKEADQWLYLFTGKHIKDLIKKSMDLYGEEIMDAVAKLVAGDGHVDVVEESPYTVLGLLPDASDAVVKASFRALVFEYHPDTGTHPDPVKYQKVVEARDTIVLARKIIKEKRAKDANV